MSFLTLVFQTDPSVVFNARVRPSVFPGLAGVAGAVWSFRRQDGDVQDVSTYIVLPLCIESVVSSWWCCISDCVVQQL